MAKIRVLVVEDSPTMRDFLVESLRSDPDLEVIAQAGDGKKAIELCERLRPDVVTLDMMLPMATGLEVTEHVMAYCPTPIVIVSSSTNRGEIFRTYDALAAGAIDVIEKPDIDTLHAEWGGRLAAKVKLASRVKVITHPRAKLRNLNSPRPVDPIEPPAPFFESPRNIDCIAIGTSTGGPQALAEILGALPVNFPIPIVIVLHISEIFSTAMAEWLSTVSKIPVAIAKSEERFPRFGLPRVILAPPGKHLVAQSGMLRCIDGPEVHSCRPSVDVFFQSIALELKSRCIAVLLTGMGKDGAKGLLEIAKEGGLTIAQDEQSSIIFGMPREAIQLGAAKRILPLREIATALVAAARTDARRT